MTDMTGKKFLLGVCQTPVCSSTEQLEPFLEQAAKAAAEEGDERRAGLFLLPELFLGGFDYPRMAELGRKNPRADGLAGGFLPALRPLPGGHLLGAAGGQVLQHSSPHRPGRRCNAHVQQVPPVPPVRRGTPLPWRAEASPGSRQGRSPVGRGGLFRSPLSRGLPPSGPAGNGRLSGFLPVALEPGAPLAGSADGQGH